MKKFLIITFALLLCTMPNMSYGVGHEKCNLCHLSVKEGKYNLTVHPDFNVVNPNTGKSFNAEDALCMSCHKMEAKRIHPVGIVPNPAKVVMPPEARGKEGRLTCGSCHDFHEKNKNYRYLRWPTNGGKNISQFCVHCHSKYGLVQTSKRIDAPPFFVLQQERPQAE